MESNARLFLRVFAQVRTSPDRGKTLRKGDIRVCPETNAELLIRWSEVRALPPQPNSFRLRITQTKLLPPISVDEREPHVNHAERRFRAQFEMIETTYC